MLYTVSVYMNFVASINPYHFLENSGESRTLEKQLIKSRKLQLEHLWLLLTSAEVGFIILHILFKMSQQKHLVNIFWCQSFWIMKLPQCTQKNGYIKMAEYSYSAHHLPVGVQPYLLSSVLRKNKTNTLWVVNHWTGCPESAFFQI